MEQLTQKEYEGINNTLQEYIAEWYTYHKEANVKTHIIHTLPNIKKLYLTIQDLLCTHDSKGELQYFKYFKALIHMNYLLMHLRLNQLDQYDDTELILTISTILSKEIKEELKQSPPQPKEEPFEYEQMYRDLLKMTTSHITNIMNHYKSIDINSSVIERNANSFLQMLNNQIKLNINKRFNNHEKPIKITPRARFIEDIYLFVDSYLTFILTEKKLKTITSDNDIGEIEISLPEQHKVNEFESFMEEIQRQLNKTRINIQYGLYSDSHRSGSSDLLTMEEALKYLVKNEIHNSEWQGTAMYLTCRKIIKSNRKSFTTNELDEMIKEVQNF